MVYYYIDRFVYVSKPGITMRILLTKIDQHSPLVKVDHKKVMYSKDVQERVQYASEYFGLDLQRIMVIQNNWEGAEMDDGIRIFALLALKKMISCCESYVVKKLQ